ncbi:serine hydrolase domain-containing protein [Portibacter lacus]|uniref:Beta-lactamase-related domain-containing protein n=1 Tax=Portibacter lacus TaxID=1099794 RepID=A0AA37SPZ1_9BACT|nr:serine hydrolase domain-containing protein [Portibacter lacus]GLR18706.1 hypothetical protein GCM10007940_33220 [Portibacter lacus]
MKHILLFLLFSIACAAQNTTVLTEQTEIETNLLPLIAVKGQPAKTKTIEGLMKEFNVPGLSVAVIKNGKLHWTKGYGVSNTNTIQPVDENTLFQAGSISKPLAALAALTLVQEGKVDLDEDVNEYLKDWKVPASDFTKEEKVTLRRLLSHTAGTTVHGFPGYTEKDKFPTITEVLNGEGNTDKVFVDTEPGSNWRYSGGGYTIMEKLVEDVSGMPLEIFMEKNIFPKIGMENSTFYQPLPSNLKENASLAYNRKGKIIDKSYHNYPEQAAAGLWTTPSDLAKYIIEIRSIANGKEDGVLSPETVNEMLTKHKGNWGLGPSLRNDGEELIFGHGGKNAGFTNNMIASVYNGDGIIILTSGDAGNEIINPLQTTISKYYEMGIFEQQEIELYDIDEKDLLKFVGKYKYEEGERKMIVEVKVKKGKINIKLGSNHVLDAIGPLEFFDLKDPETITFSQDEQGSITSFTLKGPGVSFARIE